MTKYERKHNHLMAIFQINLDHLWETSASLEDNEITQMEGHAISERQALISSQQWNNYGSHDVHVGQSVDFKGHIHHNLVV